MSRRFLYVFILGALLLFVSVPFTLGMDEHPDPRPLPEKEVDPDGLEGLTAGPALPGSDFAPADDAEARALLRGVMVLIRALGL